MKRILVFFTRSNPPTGTNHKGPTPLPSPQHKSFTSTSPGKPTHTHAHHHRLYAAGQTALIANFSAAYDSIYVIPVDTDTSKARELVDFQHRFAPPTPFVRTRAARCAHGTI